MKLSRLIYGILVIALSWTYFLPWMTVGNQNYPGWALILPFTFFYFVGLIITIVILLTGYKAVGLSIVSAFLMFSNCLVVAILLGLIASINHKSLEKGFVYAFIFSTIFLILGPICANFFDKSTTLKIKGESLLSKIFWTVIMGVAVSIIATLILKYFFNIG